jgi:hypothetical protein
MQQETSTTTVERGEATAVKVDGRWLVTNSAFRKAPQPDEHEFDWEHLHNGTTTDIGLMFDFYSGS